MVKLCFEAIWSLPSAWLSNANEYPGRFHRIIFIHHWLLHDGSSDETVITMCGGINAAGYDDDGSSNSNGSELRSLFRYWSKSVRLWYVKQQATTAPGGRLPMRPSGSKRQALPPLLFGEQRHHLQFYLFVTHWLCTSYGSNWQSKARQADNVNDSAMYSLLAATVEWLYLCALPR